MSKRSIIRHDSSSSVGNINGYDEEYVDIDPSYCNEIPNTPYVTISKGKVTHTDSFCQYLAWKILEVIKAFVLPVFYSLVIAGCVVYCYQIVSNFIESQRHPLETLQYVHTTRYEAPGIAVFMNINASFVKCEMANVYDDGIDTEFTRSRGSLLPLLQSNRNAKPCQFAEITGYISKTARKKSNIVVFKGPDNVYLRQYLKVHFRMNEEESVHDAAFLEYFPFYNFTEWAVDYNASQAYLQEKERLQDIWPLAMGFTTYSRLSVRIFENTNATKRKTKVLFYPTNDIVKYLPPDRSNYTPSYTNMIAIFEWRDCEYELVKDVVTQGIWTTIGLMVTAVLTLLRMTDLTKVIFRRQRIRQSQDRVSFYSVLKCRCCCGPVDSDSDEE